jgi:hypothetical protein
MTDLQENSTITTGYTTPPPVDAPKTIEVDDFGYAIEASSEVEKEKAEPKKEPVVVEEEEIKDPATGYSTEEPPAPKEVPIVKEEKKDPPADDPLAIEEPGDLLEDEIKELKAFATEKKLNKEAFKSLVDFKKAEVKKAQEFVNNQQKEAAALAAKTRHDWHKELKADPTFGGNNFEHSLKDVEKILKDHLPNVKNKLTESKGILPPYIMKDLAALAKHIYGTKKMVQGDKIETKVTEEKQNDPLAFYE